MTVFLYIILPLIIEVIAIVIMGFDMDYAPVYLIAFGIYFFSAIIVKKCGRKLLKHKIWMLFLFIILPIVSLFIVTSGSTQWYHDGYYKHKSTGTIYVYNESSVETINSVINTADIQFNSLIDKYYSLFNSDYKPTRLLSNLYSDKKIYEGTVRCIKVRPGTYSLYVETENEKTREKYVTYLNEESITITADNPVFLCFGGKNFFEFSPNEKDSADIINRTKNLKSDIGKSNIKWDKNIELQDGASQSVKNVKE